jgi:hypothetical protein
MPETHFPHRNGPVCGRDRMAPTADGRINTPTDARDYDPVSPTCERCARYVAAVRALAQPSAAAPPPKRAKGGGDVTE